MLKGGWKRNLRRKKRDEADLDLPLKLKQFGDMRSFSFCKDHGIVVTSREFEDG